VFCFTICKNTCNVELIRFELSYVELSNVYLSNVELSNVEFNFIFICMGDFLLLTRICCY
jgi:hypothetical protein